MAAGRSSRPGFVLVILVLSALTLVAVVDRFDGPAARVRGLAADIVSPVRSVGAKLSSPFGDLFGSVTRYRRVKAENRQLREELAGAQASALRFDDAVRERDEMLELAQFENPGRIPFVEARVVGRSASNFEDSVEIDRGSSSGLREGMPVVSGAGLVGRVRNVSRHRAVVSLITSAGTQIGVRLSRSGEVGLAHSDRTGKMTVDIVEPGTPIAKGEVLVTTGFENSRYPDRVVVGRVRSATMKPGDLQVQVVIEPVVDPKRLSFVKVLRWTEAGLAPDGDAEPGAAGDISAASRSYGATTGVAVTTGVSGTTAPSATAQAAGSAEGVGSRSVTTRDTREPDPAAAGGSEPSR